GCTGAADKLTYLRDGVGFAAASNYTIPQFAEELKNALPNDVDIYYENVGGPIWDEVMKQLNTYARIPVCGAISVYNLEDPDIGPRVQGILIKNSALMQGFTVGNYSKDFHIAAKDLGKWLEEG